jgi:hypothetical protein
MLRAVVPDPSSMGQPISLAAAAARVWSRARTALAPQSRYMTQSPDKARTPFMSRSPFKVGDPVVGDDPFTGRCEGVVVNVKHHSVGVKTAHGVVFYDHRQLRQLD